MTRKDLYTPPQADVLEMDYADPVCQAVSGSEIPDYDLIDSGDIVWEE